MVDGVTQFLMKCLKNGGVNATTCLAFQTEHIKHHMKLRETQEGNILKRSELLQSNKRQNISWKRIG